MSYSSQGKLSVSEDLLKFVNDELLPGTNIDKSNFWGGFDKAAHELMPKNKELLAIREKMQKEIYKWHKDNKGKVFDSKNYKYTHSKT